LLFTRARALKQAVFWGNFHGPRKYSPAGHHG
jgi:hypothetical protein